MRKVLIGTPCYDGTIGVWFADSLIRTVKQSYQENISIHPVYVSYDSLVQRARNTVFRIAMNDNYDDIFFIDSDVEWEPEWFYRLLNRPEPVVGAALVKKSEKENYTVKLTDKNLKWSADKKLIEVEGVGTGFLKMSRFAFEKIWDISAPYMSEGNQERMVCDLVVKDGDLISEDYVLIEKWQGLGYRAWIDPTITINHIGYKKYKGNFQNFINTIGYV
jgi:glycosyltransferase involved in cell wall biosynthesis